MAVVESDVKLLLQKIADPFIQGAISLHGVRDQVEWLEAEFTQMQCFLKDAVAKQEGDQNVKKWVRDVSDVAYDAEELINTFAFKITTFRRSGFVGSIRRYASIYNESIAFRKLGSEIKRIKNKIRKISEDRLTCGIENLGQGAGSSSAGLSPQCPSPPDFQEPDFIGVTELEDLITRLINGEPQLSVVSVVGMHGLCKTTLARKVYNDSRVKRHFHSYAWISIWQEYTVRDLLLNFINCFVVLPEGDLKKVEKMNLSLLRDKISGYLKEYFKDEKYLIVLDDIWENKAWDALKGALPNMNNGSRVMLTTHSKDVALHADPLSPHCELRFLKDEERWELFCKKTFPGPKGGYPEDLLKLGREIVEKCHGLPLATVAIGGLLSRKEPVEWENVCKTISLQFFQGQPQISGILSLSYKDLPYYLKPCFLYLGIFPEDYEFPAKKLIQLWAAEGFLQPRGNETLEKVGEDYLKELVQRSMIQLAQTSSSGGIKSCRIHDIFRDLSLSKAKEDDFLQVHGENVAALSTSTARRLAIHRNASSEHTSLKSSIPPHLRSLMIHTQVVERLGRKQEKFPRRGLNLLRVLDLHNVAIEELPSEIGALIHLKYLGCTNTCLKSLPSSIGNLHNLQTLNITSHDYVINVPKEIEKMKELRHFQVKSASDDGHYIFRCEIEGHPQLGLIRNLQTLTCVEAGEWMENCLGKLTNLRKLGICLDLGGVYDKLLSESILKLDCLQSLTVMQYQYPSPESSTSILNLNMRASESSIRILNLNMPFTRFLQLSKLRLEGQLDELPEFPENLTKLTLVYSSLKKNPLPQLKKLPKLRVLRLLWSSSYWGNKMVFASQGFSRLESLHLEGLRKLEECTVKINALPCLLHLRINYCQQLKKLELPKGRNCLKTLKKLELWNMPPLFKENLKSPHKGKDWSKSILHIPSVDISYMA